MAEFKKITKENTTWEELLNNWETTNQERLKEQSEKMIFEKNFKHWRSRAEELERLLNEYKNLYYNKK